MSSQPARRGRPTNLTEKVQEAILQSVRNGNYIETAARAAGVSKQTLYNWRTRGEEAGPGDAIYVDFLDALTRAEAETEERAVKALGDAFENDWRAASEYLRRRHPDRWSTQDRIRGKQWHEPSGPTMQGADYHFPDTEEWHERVSEAYGQVLTRSRDS